MNEFLVSHYNELYHHGVKGMKWGVRKDKKTRKSTDIKKKRHIGIDDSGNVNLIDHPTTKKGVVKFAAKTSVLALTMGVSVYMAKHPEVVMKGQKAASKILKTAGDTKISSTDIFEGPKFVRNDGKPLSAADIEKLKDLGWM